MSSSLIGHTLGQYEIIEPLGYGAMAAVYKGYDREHDRYAAIKVLPPHPGREPKFIERFQLEARTIARLHHPHILLVYDYGIEDDIFYLAMAHVTGGSLRNLLNKDRLSPSHVEKLLGEVASALDYAHREGVIHRDIKPGNILLDSEGHALLADFGIAKLTDNTSTLTGTDSIVGTPAYIAPEQIQAKPLDGRADIYALGVVVYEMLVGQVPYFSTNIMQIIMQHITSPIPSITRARNDLPPGLEAVIQRVMSKTPEKRFQTAMEFYEAFSHAIHSASPSTAFQSYSVPASEPALLSEPPTRQFAFNLTEQIYTFLFTDIEGSARLWEQYPQQMSAALIYYDAVLAETIKTYDGEIFKTLGDGVCAVFASGANALQAALAIQHQLYTASIRPQEPLLRLPVRMGIHSGQAEQRAQDYVGITLSRVTRLMQAAHGGQILLSAATKEQLSPDVSLRDLGIHRLPDLSESVHIFQASAPNFPLNAKPIRSLSPRPTNLPAQLTSFVGRKQNLAEVGQLLRQPNIRLVTLSGSGGIGKTRLSIQVGTDLLDEYEDGVFFIPLAPLTQTDAIVKSMAQVFSIQEEASTSLLESIKAYLQSRQVLLIFDNFEHILDAAPLLSEILAAASRVKVLATSRESLFIYGEHVYIVPPLDLPQPEEDVSHMLQSSAAALFVERVQAMQSEFELSAVNAPFVVRICRQLEGLPLALELAAARVRDLTLQDIAEQVTQRLALLNKGPRDLPARQRTIRGTIEWSYQMLSATEQRAFARLAVFEGDFYAQAGQAVTELPDLAVLKTKSLIQQSENQAFSMLAVLREYALERLVEFGELEAIKHKHALYYREWLELMRDYLNGREQIEWFKRLVVEQYNLQAALVWSLEHDIENAARMAGVLWRYWATQSLLSEGQHYLNQVLRHADTLSPLVHAQVTQGAGRLAFLQSDYLTATTLQQTSLSLYRQLNHLPGQAAVLLSLGEIEYAQSHNLHAETYLEESLSLFRILGDQAGVGRCLNSLGKIAMQNAEFSKAEPLLQESVALAREHGSSEGIALALYSLAGVLRTQEKYEDAQDAYRQSLALYRELDFAVGVATMLYNLGFALLGMGRYSDAMQNFREALELLQPLDEPMAIAECLIGVAGALLHLDKQDLGIQTLSTANSTLTSLNIQLEYVDQIQYDRIYASAQLLEGKWQDSWKSGQSMPLEQLIEKVLREI